MKRYSRYEKLGVEPEWCRWKFVANNAESAMLLEKASEFLHWFGESGGGKKRKRYSNYICLDSDIMSLNKIMHMYQDVYVDASQFDSTEGFDYRVLAATDADKEEVLQMSAYLRDFRKKKKGRGTNKPGSVVVVTLDDTQPNIGLDAIKNIDPDKVLVIPGWTWNDKSK